MLSPTPAPLQKQPEFLFTDEDFAALSKLVYDNSGIVLKAHKKSMVYSRLTKRLRQLNLRTFRDYCALVSGRRGESELGLLINAITTNLTKFMREPHHFEHLAATVLPEIREEAHRTGRRRMRIWSAGCSTGEEPYSIAMTICQGFRDLNNWDARILATDLDTSVLAHASAGIYPIDAFSQVPRPLIAHHFSRTPSTDAGLTAAPDLRRLIAFKQLNLLGQWPMRGPFDAIFCRNVMIYFDAPTKTRLINRFADLLRPDGWLYIGHSESLLDRQTTFELKGRTIYRKRTA
ncbi:CheR-type MCP methyltransferase [Breoghania corrubedonensis]|uniref:Chemotaxis protein methyltransferase n=1 Tax=Breoghania corrubedonensis TaxID=665038 RepID=A0A2T5UU58_9HYPH|nr:protein-glutamate O-methyltransferase CheR [Breoghania corrubedonensis]PTW55057.1 CheR-type MCP methyltransferase [Breoghania corrubedonensis]